MPAWPALPRCNEATRASRLQLSHAALVGDERERRNPDKQAGVHDPGAALENPFKLGWFVNSWESAIVDEIPIVGDVHATVCAATKRRRASKRSQIWLQRFKTELRD